MRLIAKLLGSVFALLLFVVLLQGVVSETGEVVVLTSVDQSTSAPTATRLWVVDYDGAMWLRGDAASGWTQRALAQSTPVALDTNGTLRDARRLHSMTRTSFIDAKDPSSSSSSLEPEVLPPTKN